MGTIDAPEECAAWNFTMSWCGVTRSLVDIGCTCGETLGGAAASAPSACGLLSQALGPSVYMIVLRLLVLHASPQKDPPPESHLGCCKRP